MTAWGDARVGGEADKVGVGRRGGDARSDDGEQGRVVVQRDFGLGIVVSEVEEAVLVVRAADYCAWEVRGERGEAERREERAGKSAGGAARGGWVE